MDDNTQPYEAYVVSKFTIKENLSATLLTQPNPIEYVGCLRTLTSSSPNPFPDFYGAKKCIFIKMFCIYIRFDQHFDISYEIKCEVYVHVRVIARH